MKLVAGGTKARDAIGRLQTFNGSLARRASSSRPRRLETGLFQIGFLALASAPITRRVEREKARDKIGRSSTSKDGRDGRR